MPIDDNSYEEMYRRFLDENSDSADNLPEDDPSVVKYRNLYSQPSRSEALLSAHNAQRPNYNKTKVSTMDQIGDIFAAVVFNDPKLANNTRDSRYQRAYSEWADEGKYIDEVREALDKDRTRELTGAQFEVKNKIAGNRQKRIQEQRDQDQAMRMAAEAERDQDRDLSRADIKANRETSQELQRQGLDLRREGNARAAESAKLSQEAAKERATSRDLELKQKARAMASEQIMRDPRMSQYYQQTPDGPVLKKNIDMRDLAILRTTLENIEHMNYLQLQKGILPQ